jgi:uncharacterized protein YbdZ (MbtH family)
MEEVWVAMFVDAEGQWEIVGVADSEETGLMILESHAACSLTEIGRSEGKISYEEVEEDEEWYSLWRKRVTYSPIPSGE